MAEVLVQYQPVTGPVWRAPVAESLAWLPEGQWQPRRTLPPNRLVPAVSPQFEALYRPEGLQWQPRGQQPARTRAPNFLVPSVAPPFEALYKPLELGWLPQGRGQPTRTLRPNFLVPAVAPPFEALYKPNALDWQPSAQQPARARARSFVDYSVTPLLVTSTPYDPATMGWLPAGSATPRVKVERRLLGDFQQPPFAALYDPSALGWLPSGQPPARTRPPNRLGDFVQPSIAALYDPQTIEWQPEDSYHGRALARARNDFSVLPFVLTTPAYDPQTLEWIPQGAPPRVKVERRIVGDFQQPPFAALYDSSGMGWQPSGQPPARKLERRVVGDFAAPPFSALYQPQTLEWQPEDSYHGRVRQGVLQARFVVDPFPLPPATPYDPSTMEWLASGTQRYVVVRERRLSLPPVEVLFVPVEVAPPPPTPQGGGTSLRTLRRLELIAKDDEEVMRIVIDEFLRLL